MKKIIITAVIATVLASQVFASEVYIDQAGGAVNVDVLQQNGANRINTESDPAIINGNDINIAVIQDGDGNEMDLYLQQGADSTNFVYSATGDMNTIVANIYGGIDNDFTATLTTMTVTGSNNEVNLAYDSANATNNIDIGANTSSNYNVVNLTQTTANGYNNVNMSIDGDSNTVDILQN